MFNQPIGIFDSGLGGLTAVKEMLLAAPDERVVYLGDTARVPYGSRSKETIIKFAGQDLRFLLRHDPKVVLIACGTVSSTAMDALTEQTDVPIVGVVEPASRAAVAATKNGRIAVLGTRATIRSRSYELAMKRMDPEVEVIGKACPMFVPLVENGYTDRGNAVTRLVAQEYLAEIKAAGADTVILGCTHFPIIAPILQDLMPEATFINSGAEAAREVMRLLTAAGQCAGAGEGQAPVFYATDDVAGFRENGRRFLGKMEMGSVLAADVHA